MHTGKLQNVTSSYLEIMTFLENGYKKKSSNV